MAGAPYLCLDCGLTATKAALFNDQGAQLAEASADTPLRTRGDASEIDMAEQWALAAGLIKAVLGKAGIRDGRVDGVGVSGHGGGIYPIDASGRPARAAITSMDSRSAGIVELWRREGRSQYRLTRHQPWAGQSVPQLAWLRDEEGSTYRSIRAVLGAKDWIVYRLTGAISTDRTEASNNALMDLSSGRYDPSILGTYGLADAEAFLPPVHASAETVGEVTKAAAAETGLAAGTPVIAGMFDVMACAIGSGALSDDAYSLIAGTWNINSAFAPSLVEAPPSTKVSLGPDRRRFIYVESSATSAGNLAWFLSRIEELCPQAAGAAGRAGLYARMNEGVESVAPGADGLTYLPFIHRSHLAPGIDAAFIGMRAEHGAFHLLRAIYEGVALAHRAHLDILASAGLERKRAVLSGGASNSAPWCRIFADALGRSIETSDAEQAGARGIAAAIAVGTGRYLSFEEATEAMVRMRARYEPDAARSMALNETYQRFLKLSSDLGEGRASS
jgi:L-xylulokinase